MNIHFDDLDTYTILLKVCKRWNVHPSSSLASEDYFRNVLDQYSGDLDVESLENWLDKKIPQLFVSNGKRPQWIQDPEWPFSSGKPMTFIGQICCSIEENPSEAAILHDDSCFYLFIAKKATPVVIMQQY